MLRTIAGVFVCVALATGMGAAADNLVPDPEFKEADFTTMPEEYTWIYYQIAGPSSVEKGDGQVTLTGGRSFLHSAAFDVEPGREYEVSVQAEGQGKVSIEMLWWQRHTRLSIAMADPHRTIPVEPTEVDGEQTVSGVATASPDAKRAYIRFVVEDGTVTLSEPRFVAK